MASSSFLWSCGCSVLRSLVSVGPPLRRRRGQQALQCYTMSHPSGARRDDGALDLHASRGVGGAERCAERKASRVRWRRPHGAGRDAPMQHLLVPVLQTWAETACPEGPVYGNRWSPITSRPSARRPASRVALRRATPKPWRRREYCRQRRRLSCLPTSEPPASGRAGSSRARRRRRMLAGAWVRERTSAARSSSSLSFALGGGRSTNMISFIIPAHDEERLTGRTLSALHTAASALDEPYEVIVVDDASTDATAAVAARHGARLVTVPHLQIASARNAGARHAHGDLLVFVDADTDVSEAVPGAAVRAIRSGAVGGGARARFDGSF